MTPASVDSGSGDERRAGLAAALLWAATLLLPHGVSRNRYRQEFAAEMFGQPRRRQLAYSLRVCLHIWQLRTVLVHGAEAPRLPVLCRTNLHHYWEKHANEQHVPFQTCPRCGREKESPLANSLFHPMHVGGMNY